MKTSHSILIDLTLGQATTSVLAERLRQPASVIKGFLEDLEVDGLVESVPIKAELVAWRITSLGTELVSTLQTPTA